MDQESNHVIMNKKKYLIIVTIRLFQFSIAPGLFSQNKTIAQIDGSMPGVLINAGGHKLHPNIEGKGSPTVLFENGSGDFSFIWSFVQPEVSKFTKTVSYDRAGYAWSEQGPEPRTSRQICFEL